MKLFLTVILCVFIIYLFFAYYQFANFLNYGYDFAIYSQAGYNLIRGDFYSSLKELNIFEHHFQPVLFLTGILTAVVKTPLILSFFQIFLFFISAVFIYKTALNYLTNQQAKLITVIYLIFPPFAYSILYEFHPISLTFIFTAAFFYYAFVKKNQRIAFIIFLINLTLRQDIAVYYFLISLAFTLKKKETKFFLKLAAVSAVYYSISIFIKSSFKTAELSHPFVYFKHLGSSYPEVILNLLKNPSVFFYAVFNRHFLKFILDMFLPLFFLPFLSLSFIFVFSTIAIHLISLNHFLIDIRFHYLTFIALWAFLCFIVHFKKMPPRVKKFYFSFVFLYCVIRGPFYHKIPEFMSVNEIKVNNYKEAVNYFNDKKGYSITAQSVFAPYLSLNKKALILRTDKKINTDYVIADLSRPADKSDETLLYASKEDFLKAFYKRNTRVLNLIENNYEVILKKDELYVLKKREKNE